MGAGVIGERQLQDVLVKIGQNEIAAPVRQPVGEPCHQRGGNDDEQPEADPRADQRRERPRRRPERRGQRPGQRIDDTAEQHRLGKLRDRERDVGERQSPRKRGVGFQQTKDAQIDAEKGHRWRDPKGCRLMPIYARTPAMSAQFPEAGTHFAGTGAFERPLGARVGTLPDRCRGGQHGAACVGEDKPAASPVLRIDFDFDEPTPLQRLEIGGERGAVEHEQLRDIAHGRRRRTVERHEKRKLALCQPDWAQRLVETARKRPRRALDMEAKAAVANFVRQ